MAKYVFICSSCTATVHKYLSADKGSIHCYECGGTMNRQFPKIGAQEVRETIDSLTGVTWHQDQAEQTAKRKEDHYWEVEVPRLVQKYSVETCLENGWLKYNDKGELIINKPPSKQ